MTKVHVPPNQRCDSVDARISSGRKSWVSGPKNVVQIILVFDLIEQILRSRPFAHAHSSSKRQSWRPRTSNGYTDSSNLPSAFLCFHTERLRLLYRIMLHVEMIEPPLNVKAHGAIRIVYKVEFGVCSSGVCARIPETQSCVPRS